MSRLRLTAGELTTQLALLATALWLVAAVELSAPGWTMRDRQQVKGADFVHFYSLARLSAGGQLSAFADADLIRHTQLAAVPDSEGQWFPPAYGPQVALALTPLGYLSYGTALVVWTLITALVYFGCLSVIVGRTTVVRRARRVAALGAVAFVPFWSLVLHGQLSIVALALVTIAWLCLESGRRVAAGIALGLIVFKPSLAVPMWAVLVLAGEWTLVSTVAIAAMLEVGIGIAAAGPDALHAYSTLLEQSANLALLLRAQPGELHSWQNFWLLLLPNHQQAALILYVLTGALSVSVAAWLWRRSDSIPVKLSSLLLATVLTSPHLYTYDLIILMPAWIWLSDWFLEDLTVPGRVGRLLYLGFAAPLAGSATRVVPIQLSTICYAALLASVAISIASRSVVSASGRRNVQCAGNWENDARGAIRRPDPREAKGAAEY